MVCAKYSTPWNRGLAWILNSSKRNCWKKEKKLSWRRFLHMLRWDKQHEFLFARVIDSLAGWYSRFLSKMKQFRGQIVSVHNLVPPKYCEQNFIRDKQRCYFFSLSSPFNFCRSQTDVADKVVLPSNEELQICLVDVDIQEHLKFGMLKIFHVQFFKFPVQISGTEQH